VLPFDGLFRLPSVCARIVPHDTIQRTQNSHTRTHTHTHSSMLVHAIDVVGFIPERCVEFFFTT